MALSSEAPFGVLLASAARTADAFSDAQMNDAGYKGILILFDVTAETGTAVVTPKLQYYNAAPATAEWEVWKTGTALSATGETQWIIYPVYDLGTALGLTLETAAPLPINWRLFMDVADADSLTYSVGYQYLS